MDAAQCVSFRLIIVQTKLLEFVVPNMRHREKTFVFVFDVFRLRNVAKCCEFNCDFLRR
jgi:hypothetical protein